MHLQAVIFSDNAMYIYYIAFKVVEKHLIGYLFWGKNTPKMSQNLPLSPNPRRDHFGKFGGTTNEHLTKLKYERPR